MTDIDMNAQVARPPKKYALGVLFVHGIGDQPRGDTLSRVVDPIVRSLDLWIKGAAQPRAQSIDAGNAKTWANAMASFVNEVELSAAIREQAFEIVKPAADEHFDSLSVSQTKSLLTARVWSGGAELRDGQLSPEAPAPAHVILDMHTKDEKSDEQHCTVLLAESWWARSFVPPSDSALLRWAFKVLPLALGMHFGDSVRRHLESPAFSGRPLFATLFKLPSLLLMAVMVPMALPLLLLLVTTVVVGLVPINFVQDTMRKLQASIVCTAGDSYLLVASAVSRAMMVGQFKRDLHWLTKCCDQVFIVAHSQGCAISYLSLCESLPAELIKVTWIGSGLRKLEVLRDAERSSLSTTAGWLVATMPMVLGGEFIIASWTWNETPQQLINIAIIVIFYLLGLRRLVFLPPIDFKVNWRNLQFAEIFASHDPVPNGPLFDDVQVQDPTLQSHEVRNRASWLTDHTAYWNNIEEVVLPLALEIAAALGLPLNRLLDSDDQHRECGRQRRHYRVDWLVVLRLLLLAGCVCVVVANWAAWAALSAVAVNQVKELVTDLNLKVEVFKAPLFVLLPDMLWMALPFGALNYGWSLWELYEQRAFLLRDRPSALPECALVALMVMASLLPMGRGAAEVFEFAGNGVAVAAVILIASVSGFVYAFILHRAEAAFDPPTTGGSR